MEAALAPTEIPSPDDPRPPMRQDHGARGPCESLMPTESLQVSGILLRVLADVVESYGVDRQALLGQQAQRIGVTDPATVRVPLVEFLGHVRRALKLTGDASLGLRCGLHASESAFDLMAPLVAHVPSLRDAIHVARRFQGLVLDGVSIRLSESAGVARLHCIYPRLDEVADRWLSEMVVAGLLRMLRAFGCGSDQMRAVYFEHRRPAEAHPYAAAFGGAARFSAAQTALEFDATTLDRPNLHANPVLQKLVHSQAERSLSNLGEQHDPVSKLRVYLLAQRANKTPEMERAARDLGLSVRSLRRRLTERGLSFRALTQDLHRDRACSLLRDPSLHVQSVAGALGYQDVSAFHRAFRRWTGMSPLEYRKSLTT